jgi:hypothetical protein
MVRNKELDQTVLNRLLARVEKPARYIGGEWNSIVKEERGRTLCAPVFRMFTKLELSHLGSRILYHAINSETGLCLRARLCALAGYGAGIA